MENNKIIETVGLEAAKGAVKAAEKTLTTGQLVLGGIGCFLGGVLVTIGGIFVKNKIVARQPKTEKVKTEPKPATQEVKAE